MIRLLLLFMVFLTLSTSANAVDKIKPFTSDGCSAFPDGTLKEQDLWLSCCTAHDFAYWQGGTYQQRENADEELRQCVAHVGKPLLAKLMLAGVRVGGTPYLPTQFRWGYGWSFPRGYTQITVEEKKQIKTQITQISID